MGKKEIATSPAYSLETLLNDIQDYPNGGISGNNAGDKAEREYRHKMVIMQMLLYFAASYRGKDYSDDKKLLSAITVKVDNDELLSGYLFYVSQDPQFDYLWNNMRTRKKNYIQFLFSAVRFLNQVVEDINMLARKPRIRRDIRIVFNDVIVVELTNNAPFVKAHILWENFNRMALLKKDYSISVLKNDNVLFVGTRKDGSDSEVFFDRAMVIAQKEKGESE